MLCSSVKCVKSYLQYLQLQRCSVCSVFRCAPAGAEMHRMCSWQLAHRSRVPSAWRFNAARGRISM